MIIYIVTEEGVYRHRILGVFDSQEQAEARALEIARQEDGWHSYVVWQTETNVPLETDDGDGLKRVCSYKRRGGRGSMEGEPQKE